MIRPALALAGRHDVFCFIADAHALTTQRDGRAMRRHTHELAATWLALGVDPLRMTLYRQSDLPEVFELTWVLACHTGKGLLNREHAYKAAASANQAAGRPADHGVNAGVFAYPLLMAADILVLGAEVVPVGRDQKQHVEITREVAAAFNAIHGPVLVTPEVLVDRRVATIPGLDGRKMSKSYGNTLPIFAEVDELRSLVARIVTDSRPPEAPKDPDTCRLFALYRHLAQPAAVATMRARDAVGLRAGAAGASPVGAGRPGAVRAAPAPRGTSPAGAGRGMLEGEQGASERRAAWRSATCRGCRARRSWWSSAAASWARPRPSTRPGPGCDRWCWSGGRRCARSLRRWRRAASGSSSRRESSSSWCASRPSCSCTSPRRPASGATTPRSASRATSG
jgi:tryptophanyl-tRNA synthetase